MAHADLSPEASADAKNRAFRTFVQGLVIDVLIAVALLVSTSLDGDVNWSILGLAVVKTALTAAASYVARKLSPPSV